MDEDTQNSPAAPTKNQPKSKGRGHNAALSLRPFPLLTDAWASSWSWVNSTYHAARHLSHQRQRQRRRLRRRATTLTTTAFGPKCSQQGDADEQSEDCLYINVFRPLNPPSTSLPVLFFIHGGGFQSGSGSDYDPTNFIKEGMQNDQPVVVVTINYRLNIFGFLASSDLATLSGLDSSGCTARNSNCTTRNVGSQPVGINLGFQDMKMGIQWTHDNIDAFGGDPTKITIWGQSAGAYGVGAMLLGHTGTALGSDQQAKNNPPRPLFRGAILMSGGPSGPPLALPSDRDPLWNSVLISTQCDSRTTAQTRLDCLRGADWHVLRNISQDLTQSAVFSGPGPYVLGSYPWTPVADGGAARGAFYASPGSLLLKAGRFANVPFISGDVEDEGTTFAPKQFSDDAKFESWFRAIYFSNGTQAQQDDAWQAISAAYPDDPAVGSPYDPVKGPKTDRYFGAQSQYKRAASLYGDIRFQSNRRQILESSLQTHNSTKVWSYYFQDPPTHAAVSLGVPHSSDLDVAWAFESSKLNTVMARQFIAFATSLDPADSAGLPAWPTYDTQARQLMSYFEGNTALIKDDYRQAAMDVLNTDIVQFVTSR